VQAAGVEPRDVLDDRELKLVLGAPDAVGDQLGLEGVHERFRERVVERVADGPDRRGDVVIVERLGVVAAGVLTEFKGSLQHGFARDRVSDRDLVVDDLIV
jgi:hypothetical protein